MSVVRKLREVKSTEERELERDFILYQESRGLAQSTMRVQKDIVGILMNCAPKNQADSRAWLDVVTRLLNGKNPAYYNKMLAVFKQFFQYLIAEEVVDSNPASRFKYRRESQRIVRHSEDTIKRLLNLIDKDTFAGLRDYTFCTLMLDTGIRPSEAVQIQRKDIDFEMKQVRVRAEYSKTGVERYLPVSIQTLHALRKLMAVRPEDWKDDVPVICTYNGRKLATTAIRDRFEDYSRRLGVKVTTYDLRHTFALYFIKNGGSEFALQRIMGHTKMDMTRVYVNLASDDVAEKHAQATPLQNFIGSKRVKNLKKK